MPTLQFLKERARAKRAKALTKFKETETRLDRQFSPVPKGELLPLDLRVFILDLIEKYVAHLKAIKKNTNTILAFESLNKVFTEFDFPINALDDTLIQSICDAVFAKKYYSNASLRTRLERFVRILNFYKIEHDMNVPNFKFLSTQPFHELKDEILKPEEIEKAWLFQPTCFQENVAKDKFLISLYTGCRLGETRTIFLSEENGSTMIGYYASKDGEARFIPLYEPLREILTRPWYKHRYPPHAWAFKGMLKSYVTGDGIEIKRYGHEVLRTMIPRYKVVTFHSARKTFAVRMLESGVDVFTVSKLLGHNNVQTTLKYYAYISQSKIDERVRDVFKLWENKPISK